MTAKRWRTIARNEFGAQLRSPPLWLLIVVLVLLVGSLNPVAMLPSGSDEIAGLRAFDNSIYALLPTYALGAFFAYPFFVSMMAGLCVIRDDEYGLSELLHSTPLSRTEYLGGKLFGVMGAVGVAVIVHGVLMMANRELPALIGNAPNHGPFELSNYIVPLLLIVAPSAVFSTVLAFTVGAYTRKPMAVYAVPVLLFVVTVMVTWTWTPAWLPTSIDALFIVADPTGLRWVRQSLFAVDQGVAHYNSAPLVLNALFWIGRIVTVGLPMLGMFALMRFGNAFAFARDASLSTLTKAGAKARVPKYQVADLASLASLRMASKAPRLGQGTWAIFASDFRALLRQPSLWLFTVFLMFVVVEVGATGDDIYGAPVLLTAGTLAIRAIPVVTLLVCAFLLFTVVEVMYRDAATGFESIALASPISNGALLLGRGLSMAGAIALLMGACVLASLVLLQLQRGVKLDMWPLLLVFGVVLAPTFVLWTVYMMMVMTIVRHRTGGLSVGVLTLLGTGVLFVSGQMTWVTNWPLWGALRWTDMGVFPLNGSALAWNRLLALLMAGFFGAVMMRTFRRTESDVLAAASRRNVGRVAMRVMRFAPFAVAPLFVANMLAIRVNQGWQGDTVAERATTYFERNAISWARAPLATIRVVDVQLELRPAQQQMSVHGAYVLVNETASTLRQLPFTVEMTDSVISWTVNGERVDGEDRSGLWIVTLPRPMLAGDSLRIGFQYALAQPRGVSRNGGGASSFITSAGALLSTRGGSFLPTPGFVTPVSLDVASNDDALGFNRGQSFVSRVAIRFPEEFTVNSVGQQIRNEHANGWRTVVWENVQPVAALNVIAGKWSVRARDGNAVYYSARHDRNVDVMLNTLVAARSRYSEWFAPYPWKELRLSEFPDFETNATAFPTNISFSEGIGFLTGGTPQRGLAFSVVAHEVAHQWFGHLVPAGNGPGTGLLVEGMANYATLLLHESENGEQGRQTFARQIEQNYLQARQIGREQSIVTTREGRSSDDATLAYRGAWTLWMLREQFGPARMQLAIQSYIAEQQRARRPANPDDLLLALRTHAPDTLVFDDYVRQWMKTTALPEFDVETVTSSREGNAWRSDVAIRNVGTGDTFVDVMLVPSDHTYNAGTVMDDAERPNGTALRQRVFVPAGESVRVTWLSPYAPGQVVVDPDVQVLQLNRSRAQRMVQSTAE